MPWRACRANRDSDDNVTNLNMSEKEQDCTNLHGVNVFVSICTPNLRTVEMAVMRVAGQRHVNHCSFLIAVWIGIADQDFRLGTGTVMMIISGRRNLLQAYLASAKVRVHQQR